MASTSSGSVPSGGGGAGGSPAVLAQLVKQPIFCDSCPFIIAMNYTSKRSKDAGDPSFNTAISVEIETTTEIGYVLANELACTPTPRSF